MIQVGIICEYNPFHKGHKRQIEAIRAHFDEDIAVVALMSGNFVQRGEAAILPKAYRAQAALMGGADLVLELPYPWSGACAEVFASAGVTLLSKIGVDYLAFGSECGELSALQTMSDNLAEPRMEACLAKHLEQAPRTRSYASLREEVYTALFGTPKAQKPNDILGVAYLTALKKQTDAPRPLVIKREGDETATAARAAYLAHEEAALEHLVPSECLGLLQTLVPLSPKAWETVLLAFWRLSSPDAWHKIADLPFDLAARLSDTARRADTLEDFWAKAATKKYTNARIRRGALSALFGVTHDRIREEPLFSRLLAANEKGRAVMAATAFPILTRAGAYRSYSEALQKQVLFADRADSLYALLDPNPPCHKPFIG